MIYPNPSDEVLRSAHLITIYDPRIPEWNLILVDIPDKGTYIGISWNVVDIPVDSTNSAAIQEWRDKIKQARL